jgi:biofilm protein TabA
MIADTLYHAGRYTALHPAFAGAFAYLGSFDLQSADGNYPLAGGCEARVMSYRTEPAANRRWESHRRYIDIQCVIAGRERMDVADIVSLSDATPFDDSNDVRFYSDSTADVTRALVSAGNFTIFFPHDGHRPGIEIDAPADVRKIVIKVPVE